MHEYVHGLASMCKST